MDTVLIVDDDKAIRNLLSFVLSKYDYDTVEAPNAISAIDEAERSAPRLAILDRGLPDMDGLKLLRYWKAEGMTCDMPVIIVSGSDSEEDRVQGLKAGADDYIAKPFGREELAARVEAVLRRTKAAGSTATSEDSAVKSVAGLHINTRSLRVSSDDKNLHLGPIEFKLLNLFMNSQDRALSRSQIVDKVWRSNTYVDERTVDVHVRRLRVILTETGHDKWIQTVRGIGYRFAAPN